MIGQLGMIFTIGQLGIIFVIERTVLSRLK